MIGGQSISPGTGENSPERPVSRSIVQGIPAHMSRLRFPLAPAAGVLAIAFAVVALAATGHRGTTGSVLVTAVLAGMGGALAVWHSDRVAALVAADALLASAVVATLFGLGAMFVVPLLGMLVATVDTPARTSRPKHLKPTNVVAFAAGPVRQLSVRRTGPAPLRRSA